MRMGRAQLMAAKVLSEMCALSSNGSNIRTGKRSLQGSCTDLLLTAPLQDYVQSIAKGNVQQDDCHRARHSCSAIGAKVSEEKEFMNKIAQWHACTSRMHECKEM